MDTETLGIDTEKEGDTGEIKKLLWLRNETEQLKKEIRLLANFDKRYVLRTEQHSFFVRPISDGHLHDDKRWRRL